MQFPHLTNNAFCFQISSVHALFLFPPAQLTKCAPQDKCVPEGPQIHYTSNARHRMQPICHMAIQCTNRLSRSNVAIGYLHQWKESEERKEPAKGRGGGSKGGKGTVIADIKGQRHGKGVDIHVPAPSIPRWSWNPVPSRALLQFTGVLIKLMIRDCSPMNSHLSKTCVTLTMKVVHSNCTCQCTESEHDVLSPLP